jgi:hypothetical protein
MTRPTLTPHDSARVIRAARFNRRARALAEAEALGIDLRDPFAELAPEAESEVDSLIYGRAVAAFL